MRSLAALALLACASAAPRALLQPAAAPAAAPAPAQASDSAGNAALKSMEAQSMTMGTGNPLLLAQAPSAAPSPPAVVGTWITTATGGVWAEAPPGSTSPAGALLTRARAERLGARSGSSAKESREGGGAWVHPSCLTPDAAARRRRRLGRRCVAVAAAARGRVGAHRQRRRWRMGVSQRRAPRGTLDAAAHVR